MANVPLVNGNRFGWASIKLGLDGNDFTDFTTISYKATQSIGKVRGRGHRKIGRTRGESDSEGSFTLLKAEADLLIQALGPGFMTGKRDFPITVQYSETEESQIITDELHEVRIVDLENNPAQGTDPASVTFSIDIGWLVLNGIDPQE